MLMIILIVVSVVLYLYPYRIVDIDDHQRIALEYPAEDWATLKGEGAI